MIAVNGIEIIEASRIGIGGITPINLLHIKGDATTDLPTYSAEFLDAANWTSVNWTGSWAAGWTHPVGTIETISLNAGGTGYTALDVITVVQAGGALGTVRVDTVDGSGVILTCTRIAKGSGYAVANALETTGGTGTGGKINILTINNVSILSHDHVAVNATKYQIAYTVTGRTAGTFTVTFGGQTSTAKSATGAFGPTTTGTGVLQVTPTADFNGTIIISIKSITAVSTPLIQVLSSDGVTQLGIRVGSALYNTSIGTSALAYNTTGYYNTGIGTGALQANTTGTNNTGIGSGALQANTTGTYNTGIGTSALQANTTGTNNTGIGTSALYANTTGTYNTGIGVSALQVNTTGYNNTGIGTGALYANTTGYYNTGIGTSALYANTTGYYNTGIGSGALYANTTGSYNTGIGVNAGRTITEGSSNTGIGYYAGYNAGQLATAANSTCIGANTFNARSNQVVIGDSAVVETQLRGSVRIGNEASPTAPTARLELPAGQAGAGLAPLLIPAGTVLSVPVAGAIEFDGTNLFFTQTGGVRKTISFT